MTLQGAFGVNAITGAAVGLLTRRGSHVKKINKLKKNWKV